MDRIGNAVVEFTKRFEQLHGATDCEKLLGCNIGTADGMQKAKEENLFFTICSICIKSAAEILETMLDGYIYVSYQDRKSWFTGVAGI